MEALIPIAIGVIAILGADWMTRTRVREEDLAWMDERRIRQAVIGTRAIGVVAITIGVLNAIQLLR